MTNLLSILFDPMDFEFSTKLLLYSCMEDFKTLLEVCMRDLQKRLNFIAICQLAV